MGILKKAVARMKEKAAEHGLKRPHPVQKLKDKLREHWIRS